VDHIHAGPVVRKLEGDPEMRLFAKGQSQPGLSLSRSIGCTSGMACGLVPEPDTWEYDLLTN